MTTALALRPLSLPVEAPRAPPDAEARANLAAEAHRKTGRVPPALVADHVVAITAGGDWPVRLAALEALLRRVKAAREGGDAWCIERRPRGKQPYGLYRVSVGGKKAYRVFLEAPRSLAGACECPDFLRNSLGVCKHLWWLLESCFDAAGRPAPGAASAPALSWNPVRPLTGPGDWMERVSCSGAALPARLAAHFVRRGTGLVLRPATLAALPERRALVRLLLAWSSEAGSGEVRASPALAALLAREADALDRTLTGRLEAKAVRRALGSLKRPLFPYQVEGVQRFLEAGRLLLADDMGLGKTAQSIAACHVLHRAGRVKKGLVIVPASLKSQWQREWTGFTDAPLTVVDGTPEQRRALYRGLEDGFLVLNYEQVLKDLPELVRLDPELVVLDEAQRIKNWAAKTSVYVKQLKPRWRLVLTGTPLENRLDELASLMEWVDDLALEPKWRLADWHAKRADGSKEIVGARNLDTLRARLAPASLRRIRKEVLAQLPPRTDTAVPVPLTAEQRAAHADFDLPIAQLMRIGARRPLTQPEFLKLMSCFTQQRVICNGLAQRNFDEVWPMLEKGARPSESTLEGLFAPKLTELRELISTLALTQGRKVVVFSAWRRMLRLAEWAVSDLLGSQGLRAVFFTGEESQKRRTQNVIDFHDDEKTAVFFATDAGGVGLNLQRAASACIHLDLPWNPAVLEQRSGRIYRLGQTRPVDIYTLVGVGGIEERIAGVLGGKKALFNGLFDGSSDEVTFEQGGSFLKRLAVLTDQVVLPALPDADADAGPAAEDAELEPKEPESGAAHALAPAPAPQGAPQAPAAAAELLQGITVQRLADGRLVLEAKPESAEVLASMFEGMASLLRQLPAPRA